MESMKETLDEKNDYLKKVAQAIPKQMAGFMRFKEAAAIGPLEPKVRKLIGVSLAVSAQCHWCIAIHVKECLDAGATKEEILDAAWQAVVMGGGPKLMYMQQVVKCLEDV